ncbi:TIGR02391 family protein [Microbacterium aurugineum]|uniref:TIGR02391 family protein n=1 Tax=Microbacterium aurugineum TaxID=2851642 RepID=UPI0039BE35F9
MDERWAMDELRVFLELSKRIQKISAQSRAYMAYEPDSKVVPAAHVVEQILDRVLPTWRLDTPAEPELKWNQHRLAVMRAITELERGAELREKLGEVSPTIQASQFHPWVWEGARSLWHSGHYREAVRAASVKLNAETQNKIGRRDVSETDLFKQALSNDPPTVSAHRLRPAGDDGGKTSLSLRRGIMAFAEGCYAGIRNPASHDEGDLNEQAALEQLAAFSVLARWVDGASVASA